MFTTLAINPIHMYTQLSRHMDWIVLSRCVYTHFLHPFFPLSVLVVPVYKHCKKDQVFPHHTCQGLLCVCLCVHVFVYVYLYVCMCVWVCICVCMCGVCVCVCGMCGMCVWWVYMCASLCYATFLQTRSITVSSTLLGTQTTMSPQSPTLLPSSNLSLL